jgi:hypothetical protein
MKLVCPPTAPVLPIAMTGTSDVPRAAIGKITPTFGVRGRGHADVFCTCSGLFLALHDMLRRHDAEAGSFGVKTGTRLCGRCPMMARIAATREF